MLGTKADLDTVAQDYPETPDEFCQRHDLPPPLSMALVEESEHMLQAVARNLVENAVAP